MVVKPPNIIIYSYMRDGDYLYLHIPKRVVKQCHLASGIRFLGYIEDGRLLLEPEYKATVTQERAIETV